MSRFLSLLCPVSLIAGIAALALAHWANMDRLTDFVGSPLTDDLHYFSIVATLRAWLWVSGVALVVGGLALMKWRTPKRLFEWMERASERVGLGLLLTAIAVFVGLSIYLFFFTVDDAFIVYRYAQNFAHGDGLNWNPGYDPVEGYSGLSWVLMAAVVEFLKWNTVIVMKWVAIAFGVGSLGALYGLVREQTGHPLIAGLSALFMASLPPFALWTVGGLETTMNVFFVLVATWWILRLLKTPGDLWKTGPLFWWLAITRPEGIAYFVFSWFFVAGYFLHKGQFKRRFKDLFIWGAVFSVVFLIFHFFRYQYYGHLFANPYYVKKWLGGGLPYLGDFIQAFAPLLFLAFYALYRRWDYTRTYLLIMFAVTPLMVFNIVPQMGDHFRFIMPSIALLIVLASFEFRELTKRAPQASFPQLGILFVGITFVLSTFLGKAWLLNEDSFWGPEDIESVPHVVVGQWLGDHYDPSTRIAVNDVGAIAYYSDLYTIDILGLNNETLAHEGFDADYIFSLEPDIFITHSLSPDEFIPEQDVYVALWNHDAFEHYQLLRTFPYDDWRTFFLFEKVD